MGGGDATYSIFIYDISYLLDMRVVILDPPLHEIFVEFAVVSRVLHEEVPHFILKVIRLSSLHEKNYFSPGGPHRRSPGPSMTVNPPKKCHIWCLGENAGTRWTPGESFGKCLEWVWLLTPKPRGWSLEHLMRNRDFRSSIFWKMWHIYSYSTAKITKCQILPNMSHFSKYWGSKAKISQQVFQWPPSRFGGE